MVEWATSFIESLGYVGIGLLMFAETLFPPLPSEIIMPFAGFSASMGKLHIIWVIIAGTLGSLAGTTTLYTAARLLKEEHIERFIAMRGKAIGVSQKDFHRAQKWFDRHSYVAVFLCRLIPGIRSLVSIPAGIRRMPTPTFLLLSLLGTTLWTSVLAIGGYMLGSQYTHLSENIDTLSTIIYILLGASVLWLLIRRLRFTNSSDN